MCKVYIDAKLNEEISQLELEEIKTLTPKIELWIKEGNKKKIMQLNKSKILHRIHLHGRHRRMVFSYIDGILRVYKVFTESDSEKKIKFYDNLCKNEKKYNNFIDISPKVKEVLTEKIDSLKQILEALEASALMGIPEKGKFDFDKLIIKIEKQKWIRKYLKLKELYYKLRHDRNGELKLNTLLKRAKKRENEEQLIKLLLKIKTTSALQKGVNARFEDKPMVRASIQLRRMK